MTTTLSSDLLAAARFFVGGKSISRKETIELVKALVMHIEAATVVDVPTTASSRVQAKAPCLVSVTRTPQNAILIGPDANRCYTAEEAVALTDKILALVTEVSK